MEADKHPRQADRLAALRSYQILDTPRESDYDEVAQLASEICRTPISVINLIDDDRQWFKAEVGLGVRETPLATSICSHVILEDDFTEIPDTLRDPRMADNPLCTGEPGLRFYAGAILRDPDGFPLGTLCALDYEPRTLNDLQRKTLRILAGQVMKMLDLRKTLATLKQSNLQLEERKSELEASLELQGILAREVDHRVKNSLQMVSSYLRLQSRQNANEDTREALETALNRIEVIARLHERLHRSDPGGHVDLRAFANSIVEQLAENAPGNVAISCDVTPVRVETGLAMAIGAILNEFATNSLKHAFPDNRSGRISVTGDGTADAYRIVFTDDGVGLRDAPDNGPAGIGMRIIEASALQIGGQARFPETGEGVRLEIEFKPR